METWKLKNWKQYMVENIWNNIIEVIDHYKYCLKPRYKFPQKNKKLEIKTNFLCFSSVINFMKSLYINQLIIFLIFWNFCSKGRLNILIGANVPIYFILIHYFLIFSDFFSTIFTFILSTTKFVINFY